MSNTTTNTAPPTPQRHGPDGIEIVFAVVVALLLLPVIVVGALTAAVLRRQGPRLTAAAAVLGVAGLGVIALTTGAHAAGVDYGSPIRAVTGAIRHHHPVTAGLILAHLPACVGVAAPLGLLAGAGWDVRRRHKTGPKLGAAERGGPAPTAKQLAPLRSGDGRQRVVLGTFGGRPIATEARRHTAVVAPPRSGKTRGVVMGSLCSWDGPVVTTSVKGDLLYDTEHGAGAYAYRASLDAPVWVFDPSGSSGWPCVSWSPLGRSHTWQGALRSARSMVDAANGSTEQSSTSQFFNARSSAVLALALHAVALSDGPMSEVGRLVRGAGDLQSLADDLTKRLSKEMAIDEAMNAIEALRSGSETSSGDVIATLNNTLAVFDDPKVAANTAEVDFSPATLIDSKGTLFIVGADATRLAPLYTCLLDEITSYVQARALSDGPLDPGLLLALDEVANIAPISNLPQLLATVGGMGVTIISVWQSLGQLKRWGPSGPSEILGSSASKLFAPSSDPEVLDYLARASGSTLVESRSWSTDVQGGGLLGGASQPGEVRGASISQSERPLFSALEFSLATGPLLLHSGLPPTTLEWRWADTDRVLGRRAKMMLPPIEVDPDDGPDDDGPGELEAGNGLSEPAVAPAAEPESASPADNWDGIDWDPEPAAPRPAEPAVAPVIPGPASWWTASDLAADLADDV